MDGAFLVSEDVFTRCSYGKIPIQYAVTAGVTSSRVKAIVGGTIELPRGPDKQILNDRVTVLWETKLLAAQIACTMRKVTSFQPE